MLVPRHSNFQSHTAFEPADVTVGRDQSAHPLISKNRSAVPTIEIAIDPMQPRRLE